MLCECNEITTSRAWSFLCLFIERAHIRFEMLTFPHTGERMRATQSIILKVTGKPKRLCELDLYGLWPKPFIKRMTAGPMRTINIGGKMRKISGNKSLTGIWFARS